MMSEKAKIKTFYRFSMIQEQINNLFTQFYVLLIIPFLFIVQLKKKTQKIQTAICLIGVIYMYRERVEPKTGPLVTTWLV